MSIISSPAPDRKSQPSTGYTINVSSLNNEVLYSFKIGLPAVLEAPSPDWFDKHGNQIYVPNQTIKILDTFEIVLIFPYFEDAKKINMYDTDGKIILSIDLGWFNCSWKYRKPIQINNNFGENLNDYQVNLNINTTSLISRGKLKNDCSDMRFVYNGKELPYYIESGCNTQNTSVWIKVNLSAYETKIIYLYYGNPNASSKSDGNSVFEFFDDFEIINTTKWNLWGWPRPRIHSRGIVRINGDGWFHSGMTSRQIFNVSNLVFEVNEMNWPRGGVGRPRGWGISSKNTYGHREWSTSFVGFYEWCDRRINCRVFYASGYRNNFGIADDRYHVSSIAIINRNNIRFFFDGVNVGNYSGNINRNDGYFELWAHDPDSYVDWVRIRKYSPQIPVYIVGSEEQRN